MQINQIKLVYFSATGNVRKTLIKIAEGIGCETLEYDLTPFNARWQKYSFTAEDLVLIGMPVYMGRIPSIALEFFRGISAEKTPAVFVVSYGNRDYDDALLELKNTSEEKGFVGIAGAAFIGEHSFSADVASGRPDALDEEKALLFGRQIKEKYAEITDISLLQAVQVKGKFPYVENPKLSFVPATNSSCNNCGTCSLNCPVSAINPDDPKDIDRNRCLGCFRCIRNCPQKAKYLDNEKLIKKIKILSENCTARKEPEIFI